MRHVTGRSGLLCDVNLQLVARHTALVSRADDMPDTHESSRPGASREAGEHKKKQFDRAISYIP